MTAEERDVFDKMRTIIVNVWLEASDADHRAILARTWLTVLDVDPECRDEIDARGMLRREILFDPTQSELAWATLLSYCADVAIRRGVADRDSLRDCLRTAGIQLRPDYPDGPFVTPGAFFAQFLDRGRAFHHTWVLVGRKALLEELHARIDDPGRTVSVLVARGGGGKSRLLRALTDDFARHHPDRQGFFAREGIVPGADAARYLPASPWTLFVDDAHRRLDELQTFLALVREGAGAGSLVLTARPYAEETILARLTEAGIDTSRIRVIRLDDLTRAEIRALAEQALGPEALPETVTRLAYVGRDSPLVTVVAGQLLATRRVPLGLLDREPDFRREVLNRFAEESLGKVAERLPIERAKALLCLVAALGPDQLDVEPLAPLASAFLGWPLDEYVSALNVLEDSGVIVHRGRLLRIAPDVLADAVLEDACVTSRGRPTGYIERIFGYFQDAGMVTPRLLANLAELDWRRTSDGTSTDLLEAIPFR